MANTNRGRKVYIAVTTPDGTTPLACPTPLSKEDYEALNWQQIGNVGSVGESGMNENIVSYDELSTDVTQKLKGIANAGDPVIECARNPTDKGQIAMRAAAATRLVYAFKIEDADAPNVGYTNTVYYNRGVVAGPTRPNGRNEDFILENFTLGLVQREIVVDPEPQSVPENIVPPSIVMTGADKFMAIEGIWSNDPTSYEYEWEEDDSGWTAITGDSTSKTVTYSGSNDLRVTVKAVNAAGDSDPETSLVVTPPA